LGKQKVLQDQLVSKEKARLDRLQGLKNLLKGLKTQALLLKTNFMQILEEIMRE
jgi:hypothetical protein